MTFADKLKQLRDGMDFSQEELAKRSKVSPTTISHYECGRREPTLKNLIKIRKGFRCSFSDLLDNVSTEA